MAKKTTSDVEKRTTISATAEPTPAPTPSDEVIAVLLNLLRRADQQVTTPELDGAAEDAVETYRRISFELAVRRFSG